MKKLLLSIASALLLWAAPAYAQLSLPTACNPVTTYQYTPDTLQWQACLSAIYNGAPGTASSGITGSQVIAALTYTPVNKAGDTMSGKLIFNGSTGTSASLNIPEGTAPASPSNGDVWATSTGVFAYINGAIQQLSASTPTGIPFLAQTNIFTAENEFDAIDINYVTYSSTQALPLTANAVCGDVSGGAIALTMPPGTGTAITNGHVVEIKDCKRDAATNNLTIDANSGQTIEGAASVILNTNGASISAIWNSATNNWDLF